MPDTARRFEPCFLLAAWSLGSVAPGYVADIVAVEGDPLTDIEVAIGKVRWVMKAGSVVVDKTGNSPVH